MKHCRIPVSYTLLCHNIFLCTYLGFEVPAHTSYCSYCPRLRPSHEDNCIHQTRMLAEVSHFESFHFLHCYYYYCPHHHCLLVDYCRHHFAFYIYYRLEQNRTGIRMNNLKRPQNHHRRLFIEYVILLFLELYDINRRTNIHKKCPEYITTLLTSLCLPAPRRFSTHSSFTEQLDVAGSQLSEK